MDKNDKVFNIIRRHLERECLLVIKNVTISHKTWISCEQVYQTVTINTIIEQFEKLVELQNRDFKLNADLNESVRQELTDL